MGKSPFLIGKPSINGPEHMENPLKMEVLLGKSSVNGPFSIAMLVYQRVRMSFRHVACWKMLWMVGLTSWVSIQKKDVENLHQIILDHVLRETLAGNSTSLFPDVSLEIGSDFIIFYPKDTGCWYCQIVWVEWPEKKTPSRLEVQRFLTPWKSIYVYLLCM